MSADRLPLLIFTGVAALFAAIGALLGLPWWAILIAAVAGWIAIPAAFFALFWIVWRIEGIR